MHVGEIDSVCLRPLKLACLPGQVLLLLVELDALEMELPSSHDGRSGCGSDS